MHVSIIHWDRRWGRVNNHMDARHCPDCGVTVHGQQGQRAHQQWHYDESERWEQLDTTLADLCNRTGITEERVEVPVRWTATIEPSTSGAVDTLGDDDERA